MWERKLPDLNKWEGYVIFRIFKVAILILTLPALFINLGLLPLLSDEPTRGIVTLEMIISGNYIHPTINHELYLNKPPLFNWIQALFIHITGSFENWVFRLPTVLSLLGLSYIIYRSNKNSLGPEYSFLAAMGYLVSGRILFWDSFMGLIDLTYTLLTFASFLWMVYFLNKQKYWLLFLGSSLLAALGFLMKGLPSVAFQGLSIIALLTYDKKIRYLISWQHLTGILLFVVVIGMYYFIYGLDHPVKPVLYQLIDESNRIKAAEDNSGWWFHLVEFPAWYVFEFAPLSILIVLLASKDIRKQTFRDRYYRILVILFMINIIIYWISEDMRSRYLFMLVALLSIVQVKAYRVGEVLNTTIFRIIRMILISGSLLVSLTLLIYPFWYETRGIAGVKVISTLLFALSMFFWVISIRRKSLVLYSLIISLLLVRIAFNLFNLPARILSYPDRHFLKGELTAARISGDNDLYLLGDTDLNHDASFYITKERKEILKRSYVINHPDAYYISNEENLNIFARNHTAYRVHYIFRIKKGHTRLYLVTRK